MGPYMNSTGPCGSTWVPREQSPARMNSTPAQRGTTTHERAPILGALVYVLNKSQQHSYWKKDHLNTTGFMVLPHIGTYGNLLKEIIPSFLVQKKSTHGNCCSVVLPEWQIDGQQDREINIAVMMFINVHYHVP